MKNNTRIALAGLLTSLSGVLAAFAAEFNSGGAAPDEKPAEPSTLAEPPTKTPKKKEKVAPPVVETPAETEAPAEEAAEEPAGDGKTYEDMLKVIQPVVKEGRGEEVKKVIAKYSATGLKGMESKHYAAFEKDMAALAY